MSALTVRRVVVVLTIAAVSLIVAGVSSEAQSVPQRPVRISGVVVTSDTGLPLRNAEVHIEGETLKSPQTVDTDAQGRYSFRDLPPGRYSMSAWKLGYVKTAYGVTSETPDRKALTVGSEDLVDLNLALVPSAVIVARVTTETGEPVAGAFVKVLREVRSGSDRKLVATTGPAFMPTTDDRGDVRLYNLPPGTYYVAAQTTGLSQLGHRRGVSAEVFYPGTLSSIEASPIRVAAGQELQITFPLLVERIGRLSGTIVSSTGQPDQSPRVQLSGVHAGGSTGHRLVRTGDGGFVAEGLAPGTYLIEVRPGVGSTRPEYASHEVQLRGEDVEGLVIATSRAAMIHGRLVFDEKPPAGGAHPDSIRITPKFSGMTVAPGAATVPKNGMFEIRDILGRGFVRVQDATNTWFVEDIHVGDREITDTVVDFKELDGKTMDVRLTRRRTVLSGGAVDSKGRPASAGVVIAFSQDTVRWHDGSRHLMTSRVDQFGKFSMTGLPPGDYFVAAVDSIESGQEFNGEFLERLRIVATRVTLERHASHQTQLVVTNGGG